MICRFLSVLSLKNQVGSFGKSNNIFSSIPLFIWKFLNLCGSKVPLLLSQYRCLIYSQITLNFIEKMFFFFNMLLVLQVPNHCFPLIECIHIFSFELYYYNFSDNPQKAQVRIFLALPIFF